MSFTSISLPRISPSRLREDALFVAAYVFLDWASFIDPFHGLNITPWNPAPALGLLYLMQRGKGGVYTLLAALLAADLFVRGATEHWLATLLFSAILAAGYRLIASLLRQVCGSDRLFASRDELFSWCSVVITGTLGNAMMYVSANGMAGRLPPNGWTDAVVRLWIGDMVGILVTFPILWWLRDAERRAAFRKAVGRGETVGYLLLTVLSLFVAFGDVAAPGYRLFYVLFIPIVWAALRQGLPGAILSIVIMQLGMILAGQSHVPHEVTLLEIQVRVLMLALVGLLIGTTVEEQRQSESRLRESLRLAAAGEMAAAIAHELNQPLTALTAYGAACGHLARMGDTVRLQESVQKMLAEAARAGEVVRRLRDFFRSGTTRMEVLPVGELIEAALTTFRQSASAAGITLAIQMKQADLRIRADSVQMELVLANILRNSAEAMNNAGIAAPRILVTVETDSAETVCLRVEDNGPGIPLDVADRLFEPYFSTKSSGLGLGLAISRAIVEAHGGRLTSVTGSGACFEIHLPLVPAGWVADE